MLNRIRKGATPATIVEALDRAHAAGLAVSATVVLGLGGRRLWREHIDGTAGSDDFIIGLAPSLQL